MGISLAVGKKQEITDDQPASIDPSIYTNQIGTGKNPSKSPKIKIKI